MKKLTNTKTELKKKALLIKKERNFNLNLVFLLRTLAFLQHEFSELRRIAGAYFCEFRENLYNSQICLLIK